MLPGHLAILYVAEPIISTIGFNDTFLCEFWENPMDIEIINFWNKVPLNFINIEEYFLKLNEKIPKENVLMSNVTNSEMF